MVETELESTKSPVGINTQSQALLVANEEPQAAKICESLRSRVFSKFMIGVNKG